MKIAINPGTEPIAGATEEQAAENMQQFMADLALPEARCVRAPAEDMNGGRYAFLMYWPAPTGGYRAHLIAMPGAPLYQVRYTGEQDPWLFYRLYVDGSSWLWRYALRMCSE